MKPWRVLVADDEHWVRENLCAQLRELEGDFVILEPVADGEQALVRIERDRPDLLITDIDMPFVNGNELLREARARQPHLQTVVVSGYAEFGYVREALLDGAVDYLLKPASREALRAVLDRAVANLEGQRRRDRDAEATTGALRRASTLLRDGALSELLTDADSAIPPELGEIDLEFSVYTLVLVKALGPGNREHLTTLVGREASGGGKSLVFPNLRAKNEYLVLTDREVQTLEDWAGRLVERLQRLTGVRVEAALSSPFYTFKKLASAYRETRTALLSRRADDPSQVARPEWVKERASQNRITADWERMLSFAVSTQDKQLIREVAFERLGLRTRAPQWLLLEVRQAAEYLVQYLVSHAPGRSAFRTGLVLDNVSSLLTAALENRDLVQVCELVDEWIDELIDDPPAAAVATSMRHTVGEVQEFIAEHYADNLSLTTLAQRYRVEPSYLSRAFKQVTGSNLMAAIARRRIDKAAEFIRDRDLSLTEVAGLVGYDEYAYFNRVFHRVTGLSPSDYRNQHPKVNYEIS